MNIYYTFDYILYLCIYNSLFISVFLMDYTYELRMNVMNESLQFSI